MKTERERMVLAALIAAAGIAAAVLSAVFPRWWGEKVTPAAIPLPTTVSVSNALNRKAIDTFPSSKNVEEVFGSLASVVSSRTNSIRPFGFSKEQDLAIMERLKGIILPDFKRDFAAARARGYLLPEGEAKKNYDSSRELFEALKLSPLADEKLEIVVRSSPDGRTSPRLPGYMQLKSSVHKKTAFAVATSRQETVEALVPFLARTIPQASDDSEVMIVLGMKFAWSDERDQWITSGGVFGPLSQLATNGLFPTD